MNSCGKLWTRFYDGGGGGDVDNGVLVMMGMVLVMTVMMVMVWMVKEALWENRTSVESVIISGGEKSII